MITSLIAAVSDNSVIGAMNSLPWKLSEDLKFFKRTTVGKPVIMGRKTFESMNSRPLPGRLNIVLTRNVDYVVPDGVLVFGNLRSAIDSLEFKNSEECFVIGGESIFTEAMEFVNRMYVTKVHATIPNGDAFFPTIDATAWKLMSEEFHQADEKNEHDYTFTFYERANYEL